jgi:hypothetical protein
MATKLVPPILESAPFLLRPLAKLFVSVFLYDQLASCEYDPCGGQNYQNAFLSPGLSFIDRREVLFGGQSNERGIQAPRTVGQPYLQQPHYR